MSSPRYVSGGACATFEASGGVRRGVIRYFIVALRYRSVLL